VTRGRLHHPFREVAHDHVALRADDRCRREPHDAHPGGEVENRLALLQPDLFEHSLGDGACDLLEVGVPLVLADRHRVPDSATRAPELGWHPPHTR
jgi:hypothetical protein